MNERTIKKFEKKLNDSIPNQNFKFISDYTLDGIFQYLVFESEYHPGRQITASVQIGKLGIIENTFKFQDPGFNESDNDFKRIHSILDDIIPPDKYCIWITGYFEDTPDTIYQKEHKVYPPAAFGIWIDPKYMPKEDELVNLCKDCGVLALSVEFLPEELYKDWLFKYDTKEIMNYHCLLVEKFKNNNLEIQGKDYCFGTPFCVSKNPHEGFLKSECY